MRKQKRIAWAITGSGHYLNESIALAKLLKHVDILLSLAAEEILTMYNVSLKDLPENFRILRDKTASGVPIGGFYRDMYDALIIAPATSNTVAKCVAGISDNLVTNAFAHAGKCQVPTIVFACDSAPELISQAPDGPVKVFPRPVDLDNAKQLATHPYIEVVLSLNELQTAVDKLCQKNGCYSPVN